MLFDRFDEILKLNFPFFRLFEVGKLSLPLKNQEKYETGQLFLHRVFGYRGVILFPWRAKVYDRNTYVPKNDLADKPKPSSTTSDADDTSNTLNATKAEAKNDADLTSCTNDEAHDASGNISGDSSDDDTMPSRRVGGKEITVNVQTFYQVLIDSRDCPHVVHY